MWTLVQRETTQHSHDLSLLWIAILQLLWLGKEIKKPQARLFEKDSLNPLSTNGACCELQKERCHQKARGACRHRALMGFAVVRGLETRNQMWEVSHMKRVESICDEFSCCQTLQEIEVCMCWRFRHECRNTAILLKLRSDESVQHIHFAKACYLKRKTSGSYTRLRPLTFTSESIVIRNQLQATIVIFVGVDHANANVFMFSCQNVFASRKTALDHCALVTTLSLHGHRPPVVLVLTVLKHWPKDTTKKPMENLLEASRVINSGCLSQICTIFADASPVNHLYIYIYIYMCSMFLKAITPKETCSQHPKQQALKGFPVWSPGPRLLKEAAAAPLWASPSVLGDGWNFQMRGRSISIGIFIQREPKFIQVPAFRLGAGKCDSTVFASFQGSMITTYLLFEEGSKPGRTSKKNCPNMSQQINSSTFWDAEHLKVLAFMHHKHDHSLGLEVK